MHMSVTSASVAALLMLSASTAAQAQTVSRAAASGVPLKLLFASANNPDCSSYGQTTIKLVAAPQHGSTRITHTRDFPSFRESNIRSVCNTRRVAGAAAHYVSQRGYVGTDATTIEVIYPNGRLLHVTYQIYVR
jgi:hypothetical protein